MPTEVPGKPFKYACDMLGNVHTAVFYAVSALKSASAGMFTWLFFHAGNRILFRIKKNKQKTVVRALTRDKSLSVSQMLYYSVASQSFWQSSEHLTIYI